MHVLTIVSAFQHSIVLRRVLVLVAIIVSTAVHIPFLISAYFGEQDAARIANDGIRAVYNGHFVDLEAMVHSTPLYLDAVRACLKAGLVSASDIPFLMTFVSLTANAVTTGALSAFLLYATGSISVVLGALALTQLTPIFWLNSLYGFPTIVALAFFVVSLLLFHCALDHSSATYRYHLLASAALMYLLAVLTKVDVLLASAIFCWPVWQRKSAYKTKLITIACLAIFSGVVFLVFNYYGSYLAPHEAATVRWTGWYARFFSGLEHLLSMFDVKVIARAVGILSVPTALVSVMLIGWQRRWRLPLVWLTLAGSPLVLFWATTSGNSARHNLIPGLFLCIALALPLATRLRPYWAAILAVMCFINYYYFPPSADTVNPSGRLIESALLLEEKVKKLHFIGKEIDGLPYARVAVIGGGKMHPYFIFEVLRTSTYLGHQVEVIDQRFDVEKKGRKRSFVLLYRTPKTSDMIALANRGYFLVIADEKGIKKVSDRKELQGKWMPLNHLVIL